MRQMLTGTGLLLMTLFLLAGCGDSAIGTSDSGLDSDADTTDGATNNDADTDTDGDVLTDGSTDPQGLRGQLQPTNSMLMQSSGFKLLGGLRRVPESKKMESSNFKLQGKLGE